MTMTVEGHLRALPKVELHCHVEGAARASTIAELARRNGVALPVEDPEELFEFEDLNQFLDVYGVICRSLVTVDDFRRITYEALEDAVAAGVRYREMFVSPAFVMGFGVPLATVWEGVAQGLADAHADLPVRCRMVLDVDKPSGPAAAMELVAFAAEQDRDVLVGIGADSVERGIDHAAFAPVFAAAADAGLHRTCHAGEDGPAANIRTAIEQLGVERVDHGFRLLDDPELTRRVVDEGIALTSCPLSNVLIARVVPDVGHHPFIEQRRQGVRATLNSDDPGMTRTDVTDDFLAVHRELGADLHELEQVVLDAVDASFAPDDEKVALRSELGAEFARLRDMGSPLVDAAPVGASATGERR
ncbi:adenosine deaminase [Dermatobacter hominis]|uniref:adenosine deaminase n=1 Tax=Dermatobacter hominis TaxID=2884263 RepID=UPI001D1184B0|nr:adenosine deaminase [Dermatobacter hominis]UDY35487.1 adenosine deaminase [Dermatobacter hominis]